jgi:hypothetical protein
VRHSEIGAQKTKPDPKVQRNSINLVVDLFLDAVFCLTPTVSITLEIFWPIDEETFDQLILS